MKKIAALIILIVIAVFALSACNEGTTLSSCWADKETIVYDVKKYDAHIGTLTTVLERFPSDKTLAGETYSKASSKLTITYAGDGSTMSVTALLDNFAPLAVVKTYTGTNGNYTVESRYSGKYYNYKLTQNGSVTEDRIKVSGAYMDNELIYTYLRCDDISQLSTTLRIPSALTGNAQGLSVQTKGKAEVTTGAGTISCYEVLISKEDAPVGKSIKVFYAEASEDNKVKGGLSSQYDSSKYPVRIEENDLVYVLKSITAA